MRHFASRMKLLFLLGASTWYVSASGPIGTEGIIVLRVRKGDGSIGKIQISDQNSITLSSVLSQFDDAEDISCSIGTNTITDTNQPLSKFGLKNGSMITITPRKEESSEITQQDLQSSSSLNTRYSEFDPYPAIAKSSSHSAALRRSRALARLPSKRGMSYGDISHLNTYMHVIEHQQTGPITRVYMCHVGAQRFKDNCVIQPTKKQLRETNGKAKAQITNRCAILFGTINKERVDQSVNPKGRTSLSTPLYEMKMCEVVKVHAVWEPPQSGGTEEAYDATSLIDGKEVQRAHEIAESLGLRSVGWIYSYSDDRSGNNSKDSNEDSLPVYCNDIIFGAMGQIESMQRLGREEGCKYVTLSLDSTSGATEAFQLSDTTVQMVAEGVLANPKNEVMKRFVTTMEPVLIDNKETKDLDSVLCLVNTAMLSHEGRMSGTVGANSTKKSGGLTTKTKKTITSNIDSNNDDELLKSLCDFDILMALDKMIRREDMTRLCDLVSKYSRGMKKGTKVSSDLKLAMKSVLAV